MRILHINCNYLGTKLHQLMIEKLDALGFENQVFVPVHDQSIAVTQLNANVLVCECFQKWDRLFFSYKQRKILRAVEEHYDVGSFDLIHAYTTFSDGNVARALSEKFGVPYVVAVRNTDVNTFFKWMPHLRPKGRLVLAKASRVFFLSKAYQTQVTERYLSRSDAHSVLKNATIIPNGIDDFWLTHHPDKKTICVQSDLKLLYVGLINHEKNVTRTLRAVDYLRSQGINTHLTVVGKIQNKSIFRKIRAHKYTDYSPFMTKEELTGVYRKHDIFVMPSIHETFGLVYAEAMSQGLPVIYTRGQGFDGQFPEGTVGYAVSAYDEKEIADAVMKICAEYEVMSERCVEYCHKFDWDDISEQYSTIYKQLQKSPNLS